MTSNSSSPDSVWMMPSITPPARYVLSLSLQAAATENGRIAIDGRSRPFVGIVVGAGRVPCRCITNAWMGRLRFFGIEITDADNRRRDLAGNRLGDNARNHDAPGFGVLLKPRRDIHAVAKNVVLLDDDIREVEPHPEQDRVIGGPIAIGRHRLLLDRQAAVRGADRAPECGKEAIPGMLDQRSVMLRERRQHNLLVDLHQASVSLLLGALHQSRITRNIGCQHGQQASARDRQRRRWNSPRRAVWRSFAAWGSSSHNQD